MKVPFKWLNEYVTLPWDAEETARRFTMAGLKVEDLYYDRLDISGVVTARILKVTPHPERNDLKVGVLDAGGPKYCVVSGAPGFSEGNVTVLAVPGARLPGNVVIGTRDIAGTRSEGMVLSSNELLTGGSPRPREDIILLPSDTPLGKPAEDIFELDDWVIDLELTVNFSHCLSILGVAIEASALSGAPLRLPGILQKWQWASPRGSVEPEGMPKAQQKFAIELSDPDLCPRYVGKTVRGVTFRYSPVKVERRLWLSGMRPVNAVVDATNYVMLETGQPLHAFDEDRLRGRAIFARRSRPGEVIVTLDGEERSLPEGTLVIADEAGPVAIAGVMGGKETEVTEDTKNLLLESAYFSPLSVRLTSQKLKLRTEAALRFEKGVDPTAQAAVAERAAEMISALAGGEPYPGRAETNVLSPRPKVIRLRSKSVERTLGLAISREECETILSGLRFGVEKSPDKTGSSEDSWCIVVPPRRVDISEEIDLVEEIARYYGYERFPERHLSKAIPGGPPGKDFVRVERLRDFLVSLGGLEAVSNSLISPSDLARLGWDEKDPRGNPVPLMNPLSSSESCLRTSLLPGLLKAVIANQKAKVPGALLWEIGNIFFPSSEELPLEVRELGIVSFGLQRPKTWLEDESLSSFFQMKGLVTAILELAGIEDVTFLPKASMPFHPGKSARIVAKGSTVGEVGELHPACESALEIIPPVSMAWLSLDALLGLSQEKKFTPISRFMPVERDLAVVVPEEVPAGEVLDTIKQTGKDLVSVTLFDIWRKPPVPEGFKSLAVRIVYQAFDRTLTEEEIAVDRQNIVRELERRFGAKQRV
ncbi:MAG TPA: phenylalanine--tRNA ligase subunit beta [Firmicutes bacterium]|nr:phenylalanine--tRNA ligase subunit beta [Candidatus Fermentithermobacillaceae bacterium]